jgi:hypothetical protein
VVDLSLTQVVDNDLVKIMSWYDNEWGYANQMVREALQIVSSRLKSKSLSDHIPLRVHTGKSRCRARTAFRYSAVNRSTRHLHFFLPRRGRCAFPIR